MKKLLLTLGAALLLAQTFSSTLTTGTTAHAETLPVSQSIDSVALDTCNASYTAADFEKAVELIKRYETIHTPAHWPLVGYGHRVQRGEKIPRRQMSEAEADALLRKDLQTMIGLFEGAGKDQLLLAVLAYSVGPYRILGTSEKSKSEMLRKIEAGDREIQDEYLSYSRYKGRPHKGLLERRTEEFNTFYID